MGQVEVIDLLDRQPGEDSGRGDLDPLGHLGTAAAEQLDTHQRAGAAVAGETHPYPVATRIVSL